MGEYHAVGLVSKLPLALVVHAVLIGTGYPPGDFVAAREGARRRPVSSATATLATLICRQTASFGDEYPGSRDCAALTLAEWPCGRPDGLSGWDNGRKSGFWGLIA